MRGIIVRTFLEYKLDISDTPVPFSFNTKDNFYAEHPEGALCPHKGCRARLLCYDKKGKPYLRTWPLEKHISGCVYAKKISKKQWHTDEKILGSLEYQIKKRYLEMHFSPAFPGGNPGTSKSPKHRGSHKDDRITFVYGKFINDSHVGIHIVGDAINEPIIKNEDTSHEYAFIDFVNGGSIFFDKKVCRKSQAIRDLVRNIRSNYKIKDASYDIVCVCYGEISYTKEHGYRVVPKNDKSIKWDFVILDPKEKAFL